MKNLIDISNLSYEELTSFIKDIGEPLFRSKQIYSWFSRGVISFDEMSDLSKTFRAELAQKATMATLKVRQKFIDSDGTVKYLFELYDGNLIETVVMTYKHGKSVCISSQAGCDFGCKFCASTLGGKSRDLTAGEMLLQVAYANKENAISNVVVMGVGEPLDNFDNLLIFLNNLKDVNGLNMSHRHVSVSTCGIVPKIYELADNKMQITLSVSLHAPDNETRDKIMPVNKRWDISELLKACRYYTETTNRRISFEYTLIKDINDTIEHAQRLSHILSGMLCHVNLIPVNYVTERGLLPAQKKDILKFTDILTKNRINTTVRRTLGNEINASCGQLRHEFNK